MLISMVGSVPRVRAIYRVQCLRRLMALIEFWLKFTSCFDERVSVRLWLRLKIWWCLKSNNVVGVVPVLGLDWVKCSVMCTAGSMCTVRISL